MRKSGSITLLILSATVLGLRCGKPESPADQAPGQASAPQSPTSNDATTYMDVNGFAGYASQCPYGSVSAVEPVQLGMYNCPIGLDHVDLDTNIEPVYLSVDCKNKIISARTADRRIDTAWNALPDKSFFFRIDGIRTRMKSDGNGGHHDCDVSLSIDFFGTLQCDDNSPNRDQVDVKFEAVMWTGRPPEPTHTPSTPASPSPSPTPSASPSPAPSAHPSALPTSLPSSLPSGMPSSAPLPTTIPQPSPSPTEHHHGWPFISAMAYPSAASVAPISGNMCNLPTSCYFYVNTDVQQCK